MGGDYAPNATIAGALMALQELDEAHHVQLVGKKQVITKEIDALLAGVASDVRRGTGCAGGDDHRTGAVSGR